MQHEEEQVKDFMRKAGQHVPDKPAMPELPVRLLRVKLIAQELRELAHAYGVRLLLDSDMPEDMIGVAANAMVPNMVESYDATQDIMFVTIGTGIAQGTPLTPGWEEVVASNLSKFIDGHRAPDGKWIKGPSTRPPNLAPLLAAMNDGQAV